MKENFCISGEHVLVNLELEIIKQKTRAYQIALEQLYPIPFLTTPFVNDYKNKLKHQFNVLFETAKQIYISPEKKHRFIKKGFARFYQKTPLYSILLLQIPPIFAPNYIRDVLKQLRRLSRRYFNRRVRFLTILFEKLNHIHVETLHSDDEILRRIFDKTFLLEYIYSYVEIEQKKYHLIKKGGDWNQIKLPDYFHGFTFTSISFYQYVSSIWKTLTEFLSQFLETKINEMYYLHSLDENELEIVKFRQYRYKLVKEFPTSPDILLEIFHDPVILMRNYPSKNIKIEKIEPNRLRYTISENIPLMKVVLKYDLVSEYSESEGAIIEKWWIENGNYIHEMHGFAIFEKTHEGFCRYADILVDFNLDKQLKPFEDMIIPTLESMGRKNIEQLMENVYQELISQIVPIRQDECKGIT